MQVYLEWSVGTLHSCEYLEESGNVRRHVERLLELSPKSTLGLLGNGVLTWKEKGSSREAAEMLKEALAASSKQPNFYGSYALCMCLFELGEDPSGTEAAAETCRRILPDRVKEEGERRRMGRKLASLLARCLYRQGKMDKAREVLKTTTEEEDEEEELKLVRLKIKIAFCSDENFEELERQIDGKIYCDIINLPSLPTFSIYLFYLSQNCPRPLLRTKSACSVHLC